MSRLVQQFGKLGHHFYNQCRGIDERPVQANRLRKSLSVETTLKENICDAAQAVNIIDSLYIQLLKRIKDSAPNFQIKNQFLKIKFADFQLTTAEIKNTEADLTLFHELFNKNYTQSKAIRLLGLGVHFYTHEQNNRYIQQRLF